MSKILQREMFETSRLLEFFSEKELQMQIGVHRQAWPIALLKELIDNALDACETAGVAPEIMVTVEPDGLIVQDNGPGLPAETLTRSLNYQIRVSDKAHYVSPTRGQLGNALKCLWAAPYVAQIEKDDHGAVEVTTGGVTHRIAVTVDRIAQEPRIHHTTTPDGFVKTGTRIALIWSNVASLLKPTIHAVSYKSARTLVLEYAASNPHASFTYQEDGEPMMIPRTSPDWHKWLPRDPTSPHWYTVERLQGLIAAYLTEERRGSRARTVREFVSEFRGLSGTMKQKAVTEAAGLSGAYLHDLITEDEVSLDLVSRLLAAMKAQSREVNPSALGVLGEAHVTAYLVEQCQVERDSIKYCKIEGIDEGLPFVLEMACGWYTETSAHNERRLICGVNWTAMLESPVHLLHTLLGDARVSYGDPVAVLVHLAIPRPDFTDRGKSTLTIPPEVCAAMSKGVARVTAHWTALKRQADREDRVQEQALERWRKAQQRQFLSVKAAAYKVMESAYRQAAGGLRLANARQIMYAARPAVLKLTGGKCWKNSHYFTQVLLPDFMETHPDLTASWDVVFDDRGHLTEPHTGYSIGLGTLAVRGYIRRWHAKVPTDVGSTALDHDCPTIGPANRFRWALFIEKEGFYPLLETARIAARHDLAIMSTKGMSVTAARQLVEALSAQGVTLLVCHDFDKSGFSILHTLQSDTRRYTFKTRPKVVDLGLRLTDVQQMNLQNEPVDYPSGVDPRINLRQCGATEEECNFLVRRGTYGGWTGQRVELNAMTSDQFIAWLEAKLVDAGVTKVVPDQEALDNAYRLATKTAAVNRAINQALEEIPEDEDITIPPDLAERIQTLLQDEPTLSWDAALWKVAHQ